MTTPGLEHYQKREWVDASSLVAFVRCPRLFFYGYGCGLKEQGVEHAALTYGSALHAAIPFLHKEDLDGARGAFGKVWGDGDEVHEDKKRNTSTADMLMRSYMHAHSGGRSIYKIVPRPEQTMVIEDGVSDDEIPFAIDIGLSVPLIGRIDACGEHRDTHDIWAVEYKTSSFMGANFFMAFVYNVQIFTYVLALSTMIDEPVMGGIVEGLQVAKTKCDTMSHPVPIAEWRMEEYLVWLKGKITDLLACETLGDWEKNPCGCTSFSMFGGLPSFPCRFMSLCHQVPDWTQLKSLFRVERWAPFKIKGEKDGSEETVENVPDAAESSEVEAPSGA